MIRSTHNGNILYISLFNNIATVSRIGPLSIVGLNDIIGPVKCFITDQLYLYRSVGKSLYHKYCHILVFMLIDGYSQHDIVNITIHIVKHHDVVNVIISGEVEVVDHPFRVIQSSLESLKGFRLLKEVHNGKQIEVISRQAQVLLRPVVCRKRVSCCQEERHYRDVDQLFHGFYI